MRLLKILANKYSHEINVFDLKNSQNQLGFTPLLKRIVFNIAKKYFNNSYQSSSRAGFTLIEIMIAIGILLAITGLGIVVSLDFYRGYAFRYEQNLVVSLLQKARSRSMANINQTTHGLHFDSSGYTLFELDGSGNHVNEQNTPSISKSISVSGLNDIVFDQLNGNTTTTGDITVTGPGKTATITVNSVGAIIY